MYNRPQTQFTAEFMGSNNHLPGKVRRIADGRALLEGDGWRLWGAARGASMAVGDVATGVIRLECTRIAIERRRRIACEAELVTQTCSSVIARKICSSSANCGCAAMGMSPRGTENAFLSCRRKTCGSFPGIVAL